MAQVISICPDLIDASKMKHGDVIEARILINYNQHSSVRVHLQEIGKPRLDLPDNNEDHIGYLNMKSAEPVLCLTFKSGFHVTEEVKDVTIGYVNPDVLDIDNTPVILAKQKQVSFIVTSAIN